MQGAATHSDLDDKTANNTIIIVETNSMARSAPDRKASARVWGTGPITCCGVEFPRNSDEIYSVSRMPISAYLKHLECTSRLSVVMAGLQMHLTSDAISPRIETAFAPTF